MGLTFDDGTAPFYRGFDELRAANVIRDQEWDPKHLKTLLFFATELGGETGEALNEIKKLVREQLGMVGSTTSKNKIAAELADVVICADLVAMHLQIDLGEAVRSKFNETSAKYGLEARL